ncbi:MAG TPA: BTAD domain-containing putative transcriptional regulator [Actinomycetota bacterium]|nr:BTAD domain-containing putative transcriptional regulator [Actinomycetota bacterium]
MEFLLLGPVEVRDGERLLPIGGAKQRALLADLLLHTGDVVSTDRLIDDLWGSEPPPTAPKMVQVFVSRLRAALEVDGAGRVLVTAPPGYLMRVEDAQLDLQRFESLVAAGRAALLTDPARAAADLREALTLWRGAPLANVAQEPFAQLAIPRLEEMQLLATEDRVDADLALGRHGEVVGEVRDLVAQNPLRERLRAQLMLALYRSGRQAEALEVYRDTRVTLIDELGIEPGPDLQRLEAAVLRQDPALELPEAGVRADMPATSDDEPGGIAADAAWPPDAAPRVSASRSGRRALLVGGAALLAGAALVVALAIPRAGTPTARVVPNSVAVFDPSHESVIADVHVGTSPGPIAIGSGSAWVGNQQDHTVTRLSLGTMRPVKTWGLSNVPITVSAGDGLTWIGNGYTGTMSRIICAYNQLSAPFYPGSPIPGQLAAATSPGNLWIGRADDVVLQLDSVYLRTKASIQLSTRPLELAVADGAAWEIPFQGNSVTRITPGADPQTLLVRLPDSPQVIASGDGSIWVGTSGDDLLLKVDPRTATIVDSVPLGRSPSAIAVIGSTVWVASGDGILDRIDATSTNDETLTRTVDLGHPIAGMAADGGRLWLTIQ